MSIKELTEYKSVDEKLLSEWISSLTGKPRIITESDIKNVIKSEDSHLFILKDDNEIPCGMITISFVRVLSYNKMAWIDDVFVSSSHRGCGYGKLLVKYAIEFAQDNDAFVISLTSSASRQAANSLYINSGFEKRETNVYNLKLK